MSFIKISHEKIFNETMCTQKYVYLLIFPIRFLQRDIRDIRYELIVFLLNCPIGL
jgi:hypothetical protein